MLTAATNQDYERAASLRNQLIKAKQHLGVELTKTEQSYLEKKPQEKPKRGGRRRGRSRQGERGA
jgi:hypothetical protein